MDVNPLWLQTSILSVNLVYFKLNNKCFTCLYKCNTYRIFYFNQNPMTHTLISKCYCLIKTEHELDVFNIIFYMNINYLLCGANSR